MKERYNIFVVTYFKILLYSTVGRIPRLKVHMECIYKEKLAESLGLK